MGTAQAQVWLGDQRFQLSELALPELADGEVLVRMTTATICGSDRHTVSGRRPGACPSILGHEGVGTVVTSRRPGIAPGQRVVFSVTSTCGRCRNCARGLSAKCEEVLKAGHEHVEGAWPLSGTYASHIHLRAGQAAEIVPDSIPDAVASTAGCAVATVMAVLERAGDLVGRTVLVNGVGMLGMVALAAVRAGGAGTIIACDPSPVSRDLARPLADEVVAPGDDHLVDVALEFSGVAQGAEACIRALDLGGVTVLAGTVAPVPDVSVDPEWVVRGWRTITGVHNYEPRHLREAVGFLDCEGDQLPWDRILDGPISLAELPAAFASPSGALRTVVALDS